MVSLISDYKVIAGSQFICAIPVITSTIKIIKDVAKLWSLSNRINELNKVIVPGAPLNENYQQRGELEKAKIDLDNAKINLSYNLFKAVYFGVCAANVFPGAPLVGVGTIVVYKLVKSIVMKALVRGYDPVQALLHEIQKIVKVTKAIFKGAGKVISKGASIIGKSFKYIAKVIGSGFKIALKVTKVILKGVFGLFAHPKVALALLAGAVILTGAVMYGDVALQVLGLTAKAAFTVAHVAITSVGTVLSYVPTVLGKVASGASYLVSHSITPLSYVGQGVWTVVSYVPTVLINVVQGVVYVARAILHI